MIYEVESLYISLAIIGKYSNKSGNVRQFWYHLVGISEYIIRGEKRQRGKRVRHYSEETFGSADKLWPIISGFIIAF